MAFADSVIRDAWRRSGGRCECKRAGHVHTGRCPKQLSPRRRGSELAGGWEAHHVVANGGDTLSNCEILCQSCHKSTGSFGR